MGKSWRRALAFVAVMALMAPGVGYGAPVGFTGTLDISFPLGGGTISIPGGGTATINGGSGVLTPITALTIPAGAFVGSGNAPIGGVGPLAGALPSGPAFGSPLSNATIAVAQGGGCTASRTFVNCPGGNLAGFGGINGLKVFGNGSQTFDPGVGSGGYGRDTPSPYLFAFGSGAGWTTGVVKAYASVYFTPTANTTVTATGSQSPTTLSLVSPIALHGFYVFGTAGAAPGVARLNLTLTLSCGDGLVSAGETCDDGGTTPGDGCDGSCQVEPGYQCAGAPSVCTATAPVPAKKLVVIDKLVAAGKAKAVFVAADPAVTKGIGTDAATIQVDFDVAYDGETGSFAVPAGASNGTEGWVANKATVAKYVNKSAPGGGSVVKVAVIKPGKLLKLVAKERGDGDPLDIVAAGAPSGSVYTSYCVTNGSEQNCHCTEFTGCAHKTIGGGSGAKLVCKTSAGDAGCTAVP